MLRNGKKNILLKPQTHFVDTLYTGCKRMYQQRHLPSSHETLTPKSLKTICCENICQEKKLKEKQGRRRKCLHISLAKLFSQEQNVVLENLPTFRVQILPHGAQVYTFAQKCIFQCLMAHFTVEEDGVKISFEVRKIVRVIDNTLGLDGRLR